MGLNKGKKPTMAFVDHSFHKNTGSGNFLRKIFSEKFNITDYWDDSWRGEKHTSIDEINKYDYVFYFQTINQIKDLKKVKAKIIWAPMYDGIDRSGFYWKNLSQIPLKVISFSKKINKYCRRFKVSDILVQHFKNPADYNYQLPKKEKNLFFWYRGSITFDDIKKIIDPEQIDSLTIVSNPDPGYEKIKISEEEMKKFKVKLLENGFVAEEKYFETLSKSNIFISPRIKEGIGMSFLEAMAMGMCVIANNERTMNEYIKDGYNGYLFNLKNLKKINLKSFEEVRENSKKLAADGYAKWEEERKKINDFILSEWPEKKINIFLFSLSCLPLYIINRIYKMLKKIKWALLK